MGGSAEQTGVDDRRLFSGGEIKAGRLKLALGESLVENFRNLASGRRGVRVTRQHDGVVYYP